MNILVVVVDALRVDRVGSYGGRSVTPTIDELAADGTIFENAYSTTNATDPALTSLQTGQYPRTHGVLNHGSHVSEMEKKRVEDTSTLPSVLNKRGFATGAFGRPLGRWHRRGFDRYPELTSAHWRLKSLEKAVSDILYSVHPSIGDVISGVYNSLTDRTGSDDENEIVEAFDSFLEDADRFYSLVHLMDTHTPYDVDENLVERYLERFEYENTPLTEIAERFPTGSITYNSLQPGGVVNQNNDQWRGHEVGIGTALARAQYDAAATEADRKIDSLLSVLRDRGMLEETLVLIVADHGESLGEHDIYFEHHGLYEATVRVPLIVRPPFDAVDRVSELVNITDIAPTVLDVLDDSKGSPTEFDADGRSLLPLLEGSDSDDTWDSREAILLEEANTQRFRGIRTQNWKYLRAVGDPACRYCERPHGAAEQLYDLTTDPNETENLVEDRSEQAAKLRAQLEELLSRYTHSENDPNASDNRSVEYDDEEEVLDRLESLGYR
ncbi:Arylsulfatase A [Halobiforma haloterrestris]|uniref:Arylsulfatase A n=1 Tax=Natronobacterium haloterrestre TaxID=148448 RepID=A0A1I1K0E4_NATHA|nr:sulfatase [Halobiforma haloterrestris]SFC54216.1 Arylsulfatase A [Halobiforma haloterrestris]